MPYHVRMAELVFEVVQEADGGYCAECLTENIFTEGIHGSSCAKTCLRPRRHSFSTDPDPSGFASTWSVTRSCPSHEDPRDVSGTDLADALCRRWRYARVHQVGSHIILETSEPTRQRIAIPDHDPRRLGTQISILRAVPQHKGVTCDAIIATL